MPRPFRRRPRYVRQPYFTSATGRRSTALSKMWGGTIVPCGGAAINCLGLTTQNPVRVVYLTSGPDRRLHFGSSIVELRHAPRWRLAVPHRKAGDVIRAFAPDLVPGAGDEADIAARALADRALARRIRRPESTDAPMSSTSSPTRTPPLASSEPCCSSSTTNGPS